MNKERSLTIAPMRVPEALKMRLDAYAEEQGVSTSSVVRHALVEYLDKRAGRTGPAISGEQVVDFLTDPETPRRVKNARAVIDAIASVLKK